MVKNTVEGITQNIEWFNLEKLISRYPKAHLFFVVAARGDGKTYSFKEWALHDYLKNGNQFAYIRRGKEELINTKNVLFDDIVDRFNIEIKIDKTTIFLRRKPEQQMDEDEYESWAAATKWEECGFVFSIAQAQQYKSASYPNVNKACFDEFVIDGSRMMYVPNEVMVFSNLLSTIFRDRQNWVCVCLGNSASIINPYFSAYDIRAHEFKDTNIVSRNNGSVIFNKYVNMNNAKIREQGVLGKISTQPFKNYAMRNEFMDVLDINIIPIESVKGYREAYGLRIGEFYYIIGSFDGGVLIKRGKYRRDIMFYRANQKDDNGMPYNQGLMLKLRQLCLKQKVFFLTADDRARIIDTII